MDADSGIAILLEEMDGRWIAHVLGLPGCFAHGATADQAVENIPAALERHRAWRLSIAQPFSIPRGGVVVEEKIRAWESEPGYEVNAFFAADRPPLTAEDIRRYERLLAAARRDLLEAVEGLSPEELTRPVEGERWSMEGVLGHVARSELWYLDRLGLAPPWDELPCEALRSLQWAREILLHRLPALQACDEVRCVSGEVWSARKVLRRALWHARDHTGHLLKMRQRVQSARLSGGAADGEP
jgi:uncharacterized damage-inducible protein DinB/predicted RNase H-like HicB family nuclease